MWDIIELYDTITYLHVLTKETKSVFYGHCDLFYELGFKAQGGQIQLTCDINEQEYADYVTDLFENFCKKSTLK